MKILAIRFARLGDVVLLLPALASLKQTFPNAHLTFLTGHRCAPVAELCPAVDEVISIDRLAMRDGPPWRALAQMGRLLRDIRARKFDLAIDFHSFRETNLLTWLSRAPVRLGMKRHRAAYLGFCFNRPPVLEDKALHVAAMFQKVVTSLGASESLPFGPFLRCSPSLEQWVDAGAGPRPRLALYVDAPARERIWPPESFAKLADYAVEKLGASVLVISGSSGSDLAQRVRALSRNPDRVQVFSAVTIPQLVALIASCRALVSNDTGPMHIGPAVGVKTVGLFSIGFPEHFRPLGPSDLFLRANPIEKIEAGEAIEALESVWTTAADRDPRY